MTKGSWPEAKLDYQIDIQPSPLKRQLNLLPNQGRDKCFAVGGRTTTPNTVGSVSLPLGASVEVEMIVEVG